MDDLFINEEPKEKICSVCKLLKPIADFYKTKNEGKGIRIAMCSVCNKEYQKKYRKEMKRKRVENRVIISEKTCNKCKATKSILEFSVSSLTKDGYDYSCKECIKLKVKARKERYIKIGNIAEKKICPRCMIEKSNSDFARSRNRKDGLFFICRECEKKRKNVEGIKPQILSKCCCICKIEKPVKEFFKNKWQLDGFHSGCKTCLKVIREEKKIKIHENAFVSETKICYTCKETKSSHEFKRNRDVLDGLWFECKICAKARRLNLIAERAKARVVLEKKVCSTCKTEKPSNKFHFDCLDKTGLNYECNTCSNARKREDRKNATLEELERFRKKSRDYYTGHKDEIKEYQRQYNKENKEKVKNRARKNEQRRYKEDEGFRIKLRLKARIRAVLKGATKAGTTLKLLGCDMATFRTHFETLFKQLYPNYKNSKDCWTLFLEGKIHADHIVPCSSFDFTIKENQYKCFNYKNIQPLFIRDNLKKHERIEWTPKDILPYDHLTDEDIDKEYLFYTGKNYNEDSIVAKMHQNLQRLETLVDSYDPSTIEYKIEPKPSNEPVDFSYLHDVPEMVC